MVHRQLDVPEGDPLHDSRTYSPRTPARAPAAGPPPVGNQPKAITRFVGLVEAWLRSGVTLKATVICAPLVGGHGFNGNCQRTSATRPKDSCAPCRWNRMSLLRAVQLLIASTTLVATVLTQHQQSAPTGPTEVSRLAAQYPSGADMPTGDTSHWKQIFHDDFLTDAPLGSFLSSSYGQRWSAYDEGWLDTSKQGVYSPARVISVINGCLDLYLHTENGVHLVGAPVPKVTGGLAGQTYGRYSVRFRADPVAGYKTAWLLWPDSGRWPSDGEIDFPEGRLDGTISAYAHYADANGGQDAFEGSSARYDRWHIATTEWQPGRIRFYLDGTLLGTSTKEVASKPMHWVLQTETATSGTSPTPVSAGHVKIDWVVAYRYVS